MKVWLPNPTGLNSVAADQLRELGYEVSFLTEDRELPRKAGSSPNPTVPDGLDVSSTGHVELGTPDPAATPARYSRSTDRPETSADDPSQKTEMTTAAETIREAPLGISCRFTLKINNLTVNFR